MDERDGVIEALKISNNERQMIIDGLIEGSIKKDDLIKSLRREIKTLCIRKWSTAKN